MATVKGVLGQLAPAVGVLTVLYTVPALKNATCRVIITERIGNDATFRIALAVAGAADSLKQYIAYDRPIQANDTGSTIAFMVGAQDVIRVEASSTGLSFTCTGIETDN